MSHQETQRALENWDRLPGCAFVKMPVVQALFATSDEGVRRGIAAGRIPKPVKLGRRVNGWKIQDLRDALARLAGREPATAASEGA
jgi:predicted DNA-binding transcriptional regulator AlpA